ncbi:two-component sensor histidine kinase [Streptosporangium violaceochromogenes]|nr:two-component sensor histidine kinase [Streptosporangium violaceochromogenes]
MVAVLLGSLSIRARATLTTVMVFAVVLGAGALATSLGLRSRVHHQTLLAVTHAARQTADAVERGRLHGPITPTKQVADIQVVAVDGRVIAASPALRGQPPISLARPAEGDIRLDKVSCSTSPGGGRTCSIIVGMHENNSPYGNVMVYASAPEPPMLAGHALEVVLTGFALALLALLGWGTWWAVGRTLAPVERIRREMAEITASDLSRRMPVPTTHDEIADLTESINATLERLERAVDNQRRFASDASHELRTPLTGLRAKLELALAAPEAEDPAETMRSALKDTERLQVIVADLLLLARLDAEVKERPEAIDLAELVTEEVRRPFRHELLTHLDPGVVVCGNRVQLARVLTNLLANAERHAARTVAVRVGRDGDSAVIEVSDDGLGIPPQERERIFQRFTRLDTARSRDAGGTGLGLSIARDIASAHQGSLYATDGVNGRGARLVLRLPLASGGPS